MMNINVVMRVLLLLLFAIPFTGCSTMRVTGEPTIMLDEKTSWVLLPIANYSVTPQAGDKVKSILSTILRVRGVEPISYYPKMEEFDQLTVLSNEEQLTRSLQWARQQGFVIGITGSVEEWRYKSGVEREPAVGVTLQVLDIKSGRVLWSVSGSRSGWGREAVSGSAQILLSKMLSKLNLGVDDEESKG